MNKIHTYEALLAEEASLKASLAVQKDDIGRDLAEIKEHLKPITKTIAFLSKFATRDKSNALVSTGVSIAGDIILKNVILAKSGWMTRLVVPFLMKNYGSHLLNNNSGNFLQRLGKKIKGSKRIDQEPVIPTVK